MFTCEIEASDVLESAKPPSLTAEPCLLPKQDNELERECVLEFAFEVDLETSDSGRPLV